MIETVIFIAYAIHIMSLLFIPLYKKTFYIYLLISITAMMILWGFILFELKYCPSYWEEFTITILTPVVLFPSIFLLMRIQSRLSEKDLRDYVIERLQHKFFLKILIFFVFVVILFQAFLLISANKAYEEAKKINIEYVKDKTVLDFYRPDIHKPFVKEIYINDDTRWSYHRECYLNEWK